MMLETSEEGDVNLLRFLEGVSQQLVCLLNCGDGDGCGRLKSSSSSSSSVIVKRKLSQKATNPAETRTRKNASKNANSNPRTAANNHNYMTKRARSKCPQKTSATRLGERPQNTSKPARKKCRKHNKLVAPDNSDNNRSNEKDKNNIISSSDADNFMTVADCRGDGADSKGKPINNAHEHDHQNNPHHHQHQNQNQQHQLLLLHEDEQQSKALLLPLGGSSETPHTLDGQLTLSISDGDINPLEHVTSISPTATHLSPIDSSMAQFASPLLQQATNYYGGDLRANPLMPPHLSHGHGHSHNHPNHHHHSHSQHHHQLDSYSMHDEFCPNSGHSGVPADSIGNNAQSANDQANQHHMLIQNNNSQNLDHAHQAQYQHQHHHHQNHNHHIQRHDSQNQQQERHVGLQAQHTLASHQHQQQTRAGEAADSLDALTLTQYYPHQYAALGDHLAHHQQQIQMNPHQNIECQSRQQQQHSTTSTTSQSQEELSQRQSHDIGQQQQQQQQHSQSVQYRQITDHNFHHHHHHWLAGSPAQTDHTTPNATTDGSLHPAASSETNILGEHTASLSPVAHLSVDHHRSGGGAASLYLHSGVGHYYSGHPHSLHHGHSHSHQQQQQQHNSEQLDPFQQLESDDGFTASSMSRAASTAAIIGDSGQSPAQPVSHALHLGPLDHRDQQQQQQQRPQQQQDHNLAQQSAPSGESNFEQRHSSALMNSGDQINHLQTLNAPYQHDDHHHHLQQHHHLHHPGHHHLAHHDHLDHQNLLAHHHHHHHLQHAAGGPATQMHLGFVGGIEPSSVILQDINLASATWSSPEGDLYSI